MILAKQGLCAELLHFCAVVHSCPWKCMRQRQDLSLHVSPIDLPRHNKFLKPKSWEYWLISSLFFSPIISVISHLFFSLCSYHHSFLGHHKVGMSSFPPSVAAYWWFGLNTQSCDCIALVCLERKRSPRYTSDRIDGSTTDGFFSSKTVLHMKLSTEGW